MLTLSQQLKRLKTVVTGTPADYANKTNHQKMQGDMLKDYAENVCIADVTNGLPYDRVTIAKLFPLLKSVRSTDGRFRPETVHEFLCRTGFIFTRADIETMSREEISTRLERHVTHAREQAGIPDATTLEKVASFMGAGETFPQFVERVGLPLSFLQRSSRDTIGDAIFQNIQNKIQLR